MPTLEAGGQPVSVTLTPLAEARWRCQVGDQALVVEALALGDGRWLLRSDGQQALAYAAARDRTVYLWLDGQQVSITHAEPRPRRRSGAGTGDLTAPMPGQVVEVRVTVGQQVSAGAVLLVLEAMKMEIRINAPTDGVISALHVTAGQLVQRGQRLLDMQPADV